MDSSRPKSRVATEPPPSSDSEVMLSSEESWRSAISSPRTPSKPLAEFGRESILKTPVKVEENEVDESDAVAWSASRAGFTPRTPLKRPRSFHPSAETENEDGGDVRPKSESPEFPTLKEFLSPSKRQKCLREGSQVLGEQSTHSELSVNQKPVKDSADETSDYEFDLEDSDSSDDDHDEHSLFVSPPAAPFQKKKKTRQKSVRSSKEWWDRFYRTRVAFPKRRSHKLFANKGATSKIDNFINHNPIAAHTTNSNEKEIPIIAASSKKDFFAQVLRNVKTDGRIHNCRGDKTALKIAGEGFGRANVKCGADNRWSVNGIKTPLYNHQLLCAHWMLGREFDPEGPSGGLNCDSMGLGKTLEMIATIVGNRRPDDAIEQGIGPSLIVVPSQLAAQWISEIATHLAGNKTNVLRYAASQNLTQSNIMSADLVVTTYPQIRMSSPYPPKQWCNNLARQLKESGLSADAQTDIEEWIEDNRQTCGKVLHQINWFRIILDEAHHIKNSTTKISHAVNALLGKYRWAMTGTPMMNSREELYAYFRFLKDPETSTLAAFKRRFCNHKDLGCNDRLDGVLSRLVIRRTMQSKILGNEIIKLPTPHLEDVALQFEPATEVLYRAVETKFRKIIQEKEWTGADPRDKMRYIIILLLRLRQFTAHPMIIEPQMKIMFSIGELREIQRNMQGSNAALHDRIEVWIGDLKHGRELPDSYKVTDEDLCPICDDPVEEPYQIRAGCNHVFCHDCIDIDIREQTARTDKLLCPALDCGKPFDGDRLKKIGVKSKDVARDCTKGRDSLDFLPRLDTRSEWLEEFDKGKTAIQYSSKVEAIRGLLRQWKLEAPSDKIVIFVQWKLMMRVIGIMLEEEDRRFLYFAGEMKDTDRADALNTFQKDPNITVLLIGLKVGGEGLNLAFANRAIMIDLYWNAAVESQANGRIYRMGQVKETHFRRLLMKQSVDIRLIRLQVYKSTVIEGTLEGKSDLNQEEKRALFGEITFGKHGSRDLVEDYDKLEAWWRVYSRTKRAQRKV